MPSRISVYLLGATGRTGSSIADAILANPDQFKLIAVIRPSSASKPAVASLRERGADIHVVDLDSLKHEQLVSEIRSAHTDVLISTIIPADPADVSLQKNLAKAAKEAGVKRFVPSDWASACPPGVMFLQDAKQDTHAYIKEIGLGYTFIDVGFWTELFGTIVNPSKAEIPQLNALFQTCYGSGSIKTALTDRRDIGTFVVRIIADDRTLNQYVFVWGEELSQNETYALAEKVTGKKNIEPPARVSVEELKKRKQNAEGQMLILYQFMFSALVRGDNTIENAKRPEYGGALDARELYPDVKIHSLEDLMLGYHHDAEPTLA